MMRDVCSPMPMWFPPCRTSRLFAVVGSMQKEDAHCGDRKDHPLDKSQQQLSSAQKLFSPHTPEHIPGQQQSQTAPSHHAWGILQEEGCRSGSSQHLILVAKSKAPSQAACSMTRLKAEVRVCSGASPRSQLINWM